MANEKSQPKKRKKAPTKYSKLLQAAAKELASRKKSLIQAERALAKSKSRHEELVADVARLDMLERSLRAFVDGSEPPVNVKYVYNYPQWVWQPGYTFTVPSYQQQPWSGYTTGITQTSSMAQMGGLHSQPLGAMNCGLTGSNSFNLDPAMNAIASTSSMPYVMTGTLTTSHDFTVDLSSGAEAEEPVSLIDIGSTKAALLAIS